jgi:hypothetical protein
MLLFCAYLTPDLIAHLLKVRSLDVRLEKCDKRRRGTFALLSFVSFSKLVILVNTGQPVENNTAYTRYRCDFPASLYIRRIS